jgi:Cu/Ag efflux protein CusF
MKKIFALALMGFNLIVQVVLADENINEYPQKKLSVKKQCGEHSQLRTFATAGIVKKIDPVNGIVTIFLDPVPALKWPLMIRIFSVSDRSMFGRFKVGEMLKFEFERDESNEMVIDIK